MLIAANQNLVVNKQHSTSLSLPQLSSPSYSFLLPDISPLSCISFPSNKAICKYTPFPLNGLLQIYSWKHLAIMTEGQDVIRAAHWL